MGGWFNHHTETRTGTDIMQKQITLAVFGTRTGHLKAIEISLKHALVDLRGAPGTRAPPGVQIRSF